MQDNLIMVQDHVLTLQLTQILLSQVRVGCGEDAVSRHVGGRALLVGIEATLP